MCVGGGGRVRSSKNNNCLHQVLLNLSIVKSFSLHSFSLRATVLKPCNHHFLFPQNMDRKEAVQMQCTVMCGQTVMFKNMLAY